MAKIKVHGGDFVVGETGSFLFGVLSLPTPGGSFFGLPVSKTEKIPLSQVVRVQTINKEMKHRTGAAVGRGLIGGLIAGPVGAVVGFTTTDHVSDVTFEAEFEGGRRLLATTNAATYTKLLAAAFDYKPSQEHGGPSRPVAPSPASDEGGTNMRDFWNREIPARVYVPILAAVFGLTVIFLTKPNAADVAAYNAQEKVDVVAICGYMHQKEPQWHGGCTVEPITKTSAHVILGRVDGGKLAVDSLLHDDVAWDVDAYLSTHKYYVEKINGAWQETLDPEYRCYDKNNMEVPCHIQDTDGREILNPKWDHYGR